MLVIFESESEENAAKYSLWIYKC